jgi:hypothetical protein
LAQQAHPKKLCKLTQVYLAALLSPTTVHFLVLAALRIAVLVAMLFKLMWLAHLSTTAQFVAVVVEVVEEVLLVLVAQAAVVSTLQQITTLL